MGGRAAEEIFLHHITTGAGNDIERATEIARQMVCEWGMSPLGPLTFGKKEEAIFLGREIAQHRDYSEDTAIKIDGEVRGIITSGYCESDGTFSKPIAMRSSAWLRRCSIAKCSTPPNSSSSWKASRFRRSRLRRLPPLRRLPHGSRSLRCGPNRGRFRAWPRAKNRLRLRTCGFCQLFRRRSVFVGAPFLFRFHFMAAMHVAIPLARKLA